MQHPAADDPGRVLGHHPRLDHQAGQSAQGGRPHQHPVLHPGQRGALHPPHLPYITLRLLITPLHSCFPLNCCTALVRCLEDVALERSMGHACTHQQLHGGTQDAWTSILKRWGLHFMQHVKQCIANWLAGPEARMHVGAGVHH